MTNKVEFSLNEKRQAALKAKTRKTVVYLVKYLLIFGIAFVIVYPLLVKLSVSFMSESDLSDLTVKWIPKHFSLDNYKKVLEALNIKKAFFNSLFYTVGRGFYWNGQWKAISDQPRFKAGRTDWDTAVG